MLLCMGQVFLFAQEDTPKFRLELSQQSIFLKGSILEITTGVGFLIVEKKYNSASHLSGFWRLGDRLELGFGLGYANRDINGETLFCLGDNPCRRPEPLTWEYMRIRSLEIPVELRWKYWKSAKRIVPYFSVGIANRIPIFNQDYNSGEKARLSMGNLSIGVFLGAGAQVEVFENWSLLFAMEIRKDNNFKFKKDPFNPKNGKDRWFNEGVIKLGIGRNF